MDRVREVLRLKEQGLTQREIHRKTGIARSCIQGYLILFEATGVTYKEASEQSDQGLRTLLKKKVPGRNRAEIKDPSFELIHKEYLSRKGVTLELLWQEWIASREAGYTYSTFCRRYREWARDQRVVLRSEYRGGEKLLSDYAGECLSWWDEGGEEHSVEIFVAVLGASNFIYAEATPSQRVTHWVGSHIRAFSCIGGVPEALVIDNLKSGVTRACRYEPELNKTFEEFGAHFSTTILPTRAAKPRDKAKVEKAVQDVERWVLAPLRNRRFASVAEINLAIEPLLETLNNRIMQDYKVSRQELFERVDKPALRPLPTVAFVPATWKLARVGLDYHIQIDNHFYSVPYSLVREEVWVRISEGLVEVFHDNTRVASHYRSLVKYRFSTTTEHMPSAHQAVRSWTAENFQKWSQEVGVQTEHLVNTILSVSAHKEQGFRSILGLQRLEKKFGKCRLEKAAAVANERRVPTQRFVRSVLEHLATTPPNESTTEAAPVVVHSNLRGEKFYH
jgi:transposase